MSTIRRATRLTLSASATDEPPYFCTTRLTARSVPDSPELDVFALDPHRGVLDLRVRPPRDEIEAALPADRVQCEERLSGTGLVFRNAFPNHDHPRLAKLRASYEERTGRAPLGRFNAAAPYTWISLDQRSDSNNYVNNILHLCRR